MKVSGKRSKKGQTVIPDKEFQDSRLTVNTFGVIIETSNLDIFLDDVGIKLLPLRGDCASRNGADKSPLGHVLVRGAKCRPEVTVAQLEEWAQVGKAGGGDTDSCFDASPHDDGNLVVWINGQINDSIHKKGY